MTVAGQFYNVSRTIMLLMHLIEIEMRELYRTATPLFANVMVFFEHHLKRWPMSPFAVHLIPATTVAWLCYEQNLNDNHRSGRIAHRQIPLLKLAAPSSMLQPRAGYAQRRV